MKSKLLIIVNLFAVILSHAEQLKPDEVRRKAKEDSEKEVELLGKGFNRDMDDLGREQENDISDTEGEKNGAKIKIDFEMRDWHFKMDVPEVYMQRNDIKFSVPRIVSKRKTVSFDVPVTVMRRKQGPPNPQTTCGWYDGEILGVKTKTWQCKIEWTPTYFDFPDVEMRRQEYSMDIPEVDGSSESSISIDVPSVRMVTRDVTISYPAPKSIGVVPGDDAEEKKEESEKKAEAVQTKVSKWSEKRQHRVDKYKKDLAVSAIKMMVRMQNAEIEIIKVESERRSTEIKNKIAVLDNELNPLVAAGVSPDNPKRNDMEKSKLMANVELNQQDSVLNSQILAVKSGFQTAIFQAVIKADLKPEDLVGVLESK